MRKVKFTQSNFSEKLTAILQEFPKLEDIHPFYADLMNVLYDKVCFRLFCEFENTYYITLLLFLLGPLQVGVGTDQHRPPPHRQRVQGLRPAAQVRGLAVPLQAAEEGGAGADGDHHEAAEPEPAVPRAGPAAPQQTAHHRPQHQDPHHHRYTNFKTLFIISIVIVMNLNELFNHDHRDYQ